MKWSLLLLVLAAGCAQTSTGRLVHNLRSSNHAERACALRELSEREAREVVPMLMAELATEADPTELMFIMAALRACGPAAAPAVPQLMAIMLRGASDPSTRSQRNTIAAAMTLASVGQPAVAVLAEELARTSNRDVVERIHFCCARMDSSVDQHLVARVARERRSMDWGDDFAMTYFLAELSTQ